MKRIVTFGLVFSLAAMLAGCGVSKQDFNRVSKELANSQAAQQEAVAELEKCQSSYNDCNEQVKQCKERLDICIGNSAQTEEELKALDQEYSETQAQYMRLKRANDLREKALAELLAKFEALIKSGKLSIGIHDNRMVINLPSGVLFRSGKAKLSKKGRQAVKEVAIVLATIDSRMFQVAGHTDNKRGRGKVNTNWTLSYKRARAVFDLLVKSGMDESKLSISAYAEYSPVASNDTDEGREKNRRIEIVLLPSSDELPLKQLKKLEKVQEIKP